MAVHGCMTSPCLVCNAYLMPQVAERVQAFIEDEPEPVPRDILKTLFRGLVFSGHQITQDQREAAWKWLEDRNPYEDMGR